MNWYKNLKQSRFTPPGYVFSIVWRILYFLLAIYFILLLNPKFYNEKAVMYFLIQMVINFTWTYVFFRKRMLKTAWLMIVLMIIFTVLSLIESRKKNKLLGLILIPYITWLCIALYFNSYIIVNN